MKKKLQSLPARIFSDAYTIKRKESGFASNLTRHPTELIGKFRKVPSRMDQQIYRKGNRAAGLNHSDEIS